MVGDRGMGRRRGTSSGMPCRAVTWQSFGGGGSQLSSCRRGVGLSRQSRCQRLRALVIFVGTPNKLTKDDFKPLLFLKKFLPPIPSRRCKVCIFLFNKWLPGCVCVCVSVPPPAPVLKVRRVLVGRLSIPSVTLAVPSFHASAAPRESPSLGSLSALFNERAPPPECRVKPNQYSGRGGGVGGGWGGQRRRWVRADVVILLFSIYYFSFQTCVSRRHKRIQRPNLIC